MAVKLIFVFFAAAVVARASAAATACGCTDNHNPVCARQGDKWITYINKCHADCQHAEDIVEGSCRPPDKAAAAHERVKKDAPPCACPDIFNPVCGSDGVTYDNPQCAQSCYGVTEYTQGECGEAGPTNSPCACSREYHLVCSPDLQQRFSNPCLARCHGVMDYVSCPEEDYSSEEGESGPRPTPCHCTAHYDPICADGVDYASRECAVNCQGVTNYREGRCNEQSESDEADSRPCSCIRIYAPVCADGVDYANEDCAVNCGGVTNFTHGRCDGTSIGIVRPPSCDCTREYFRVCSADGQQSFPNRCVAECHGVTDAVSCPEEDYSSEEGESGPRPTPCHCTAHYDPICADGVDYASRECAVNCQGVTNYREGRCSEESESDDADYRPCFCNRIYGPVCANGVEYVNEDCAVNCHGVTEFTNGRCDGTSIGDRPSCQCTQEYSPVCSADGQQRYPNPCVAECHGLTNPESCPDDDEDRVANLPFDDSDDDDDDDQADGPPCACNLAYDPICADGVDHPSLDCAVRCGGVTSFRPGTCGGRKQLTKKLLKEKHVAKKNVAKMQKKQEKRRFRNG